MLETSQIYKELGVSAPVLEFGNKIEESLKDRFAEIDKVAEFNQLKGQALF